ncbi:MAG TPA: SEC-C metal-binding domain-containing protein [Bacteroidia bacterium]|nr:SEC-C metal-binding domain-containing protein [Bacteroidia bacterium]
MVTKSIERAQKKVEENNFGIRKRLLEYDDVMNSQREVIYKKRRHALFGERLSLDLDNMQYDLSESIANSFDDNREYNDFKMEIIRAFSMEAPVTETEFMKMKAEELASKIYASAKENYFNKGKLIADKAAPVIKQLFETQGQVIENILVPYTDGIKQVQVAVNLKKAYESQGTELMRAFERTITLALIDDAWKEHLREMDELKTSVQNAVYEQKDPLLIYKFESSGLFKKMLEEINRDVLSFLFKGFIPAQDPANVREARPPQRTDMSKLKTSHEEVPAGATVAPDGQQQQPQAPAPQKVQPVRVEPKVGRNDPCPCGSGKKYKNCHGIGEN